MPQSHLQFIFFGTPDVAKDTLELLHHNGQIPVLIVTSPDRPSGRGMHMAETPVSQWARLHNIRCIKPEKLDENFIASLAEISFDTSVVVAYGKIMPQILIALPKYGTLNVHYSLLPKYRGASPVEQALLNGDTITGVSIQEMRFKLDSGPLLASKEEPIHITDTKESLRKRLIEIGVDLLSEVLEKLGNGIEKMEQDETQASHCSKIKKEDGEIDPRGNSFLNWNRYRAFEGWPGTYFFIKQKDRSIRIKIAQARYENDSFIIERVIPEGKKEIPYEDFLRNSNTLK